MCAYKFGFFPFRSFGWIVHSWCVSVHVFVAVEYIYVWVLLLCSCVIVGCCFFCCSLQLRRLLVVHSSFIHSWVRCACVSPSFWLFNCVFVYVFVCEPIVIVAAGVPFFASAVFLYFFSSSPSRLLRLLADCVRFSPTTVSCVRRFLCMEIDSL